LLIVDLAASPAGRTGSRLAAGGGAAALAIRARFASRKLDLGGGAEDRVLEVDFKLVLQVGAALRPASAPSASAAEEIAEAEEVAENVGEVAEVGGVETAGRGTVDALVAEAVVAFPFLLIAEHRIGFGRLFEAVFGRLVAGVAIGVVLERKSAVGALDLASGDAALDAEHFVIISFSY